MTIDEMADRLKKNEIEADEAYIKALLEEEQMAERDILYLLILFWSDKRNKRKLYKEINSIVTDLFDVLEEDLSMEFAKRHQEGYAEGAFLAQLLLGTFSDVSNAPKYNPNWHFNKGSFLDDLRYYKNRLLDDIGKELERMIALKAPVETAIGGIKRPFKKLSNSTKVMVDTEMVYAERQGLKEAYKDYEADKYRYLATLDHLTCERCGELDGRVFPLSQATVGANYPPMHPHCRCTVIPVFSDFDKNGRAAKDENDETIEVSMTYDEWKDKYGSALKEDAEDFTVNPITKDAIDNVKLPDVPNLTEEQRVVLEDRHKALLEYAKDSNNSMEVALLLDDNMNPIGDYIIGTANEIDLKVTGVSRAKYILHNHPNNRTFSMKDINFLTRNQHTQYLSLVKNNGKVEVLYKADNFNGKQVKVELERLEKRFKTDIAKNKQKGYNKVVEKFLEKTKSGLSYKGD